MARKSYQSQLEHLRAEVGAMAETTLERYAAAVDVLDSGDPMAAQRIIEGDEDINQWYLDIEDDCIELLALQQPVASDLRFIASSFKIVTDLERIGDLATNLAQYGRESEGNLVSNADVAPIAQEAGDMVEAAMAAYERGDADAAREVAARDADLDDLCQDASEALVRELLTTTTVGDVDQVESTLENVSRALLTIRDLERVGDHAVNICARTLYMVENDDGLLY